MDFWKCNGVLSKESLSPSDIFGVSDNSSLLIRIKQLAKTMVISTISQDIKTNSAFTLVVRLKDVLLFKEKGEVILANSKDALVRKSWHLFVRIQRRSVYLKLVRRLISLHIS